MSKKLFNRYYKRLMFHGMIKALFLGLIVGFIGLLVSSLVFWILGYKLLWLCLTVFAALTLITTPICYFVFYRPNTKEIATRIDECGLEERMITMTELEGDDSFIARMQREDALKALNTVDAKLLKFIVSVPVLIVLGCTCILGASAAVVEGLYQTGVIEPGNKVISTPENPPVFYEVSYDVKGDGEILGEITQNIQEGHNSDLVEAVALEGYTFVKWTDKDGNEVGDEPARFELNVTSDITLIAEFQETSYDNNGSDGEEGDEGEEGDDGDDGDNDGEGKPKKDGKNGKDGKSDQNGENQPSNGAGSQYEENNQVIDGKVYYGDEYDSARDDAMDDMSGNNSISGDNKDIASGYFDTIKN